MRNFVIANLIFSFAISQPAKALEIIPTIEGIENPAKYLEQIMCPNGTFDVHEARKFIFQLKTEIRTTHGIDLDLSLMVEEALGNLIKMGKFSPEEIDLARVFYAQIFDVSDQSPETWTHDSWHWGKKKNKNKCNKKKDMSAQTQELVLPDKMAGGFMLCLGGSILCLLPFGVTQTLGTGLILTGVGFIVTSSSDGEKPYYVDKTNGTASPIDSSDSSASIGIGAPF